MSDSEARMTPKDHSAPVLPKLGIPTRNQLTLIWNERSRQERMKAEGRFTHTCADPEMTDYERFAVLGEEFGEVAREVLTNEGRRLARDTRGTDAALRDELIQVAAVCVAWCEAISARFVG